MPCSCHGHGAVTLNAEKAAFRFSSNPLRMDPTRTTLIRRRFMGETQRRFSKLRRAIVDFMVEEDALGLSAPVTIVVQNVQARQYQFLSPPSKLAAFNAWFKEQVDKDIFSPAPGTNVNRPWTTDYIESAYKRGLLNAYLSSREAQFAEVGGFGDQTQEQFLRSAFMAPEAMSKVQLLGTRAWEGMSGITSSMGAEMNRILAEGLIDGSSARAIAREMVNRVEGMTKNRAMLIARTEVIYAHAEGQLDSFEKLGVKELGIRAEWTTAGDDRVCEFCAEQEGRVFTIDEARSLIPLHPNCRCSWTPRTMTDSEMKMEKARQARLDAIRGKEAKVIPDEGGR